MSKSEEDLLEIGRSLIDFSGDEKILVFDGDMGAGKTTLIKYVCKLLNVTDHVSSPTFSLVNEYRTENGNTIYHFDFYRIKSEEEALDIGIEEYLDSGHYCFIEWPWKIASLIPDNYILIKINPTSQNHRTINLVKYE
ncbi:MAG: tRNA (adenosine(37)-N6)-threonylcarbamoyltransferase complex ATPase subunit type 1 TsaE [Cyclobacteriaceae bacterium]